MKELADSRAKRMIVLAGVVIALTAIVSCSRQQQKFQAPLFNNLGNYHVETSTKSKDANRFFVQGLLLTYNFNHGEAARSFREAIRLDSTFAMAYWGLSYTLGPNYNAAMESAVREEVFWAVEKAVQNTAFLPWEIALIDAMKVKYVPGKDEPQLEAHSASLRNSAKTLKEDANIQAFFAEALLLEHPWDLYEYKGGPLKEWTPEILMTLKRALDIDPDHPLANHLFIHATEASPEPEAALAVAKRLKDIAPGAGHLVHMPSHTYINTGDYHLGTEVNLLAVTADSSYAAQCKAQGSFPLYYYHNYHFLAACAALEGRGSLAIEASFRMVQTIDKSLLSTPGFETTQHFMTIPYNVLVKFEQWEKILTLKAPDSGYPYLTGMWAFARGMAFANLGQTKNANDELARLVEVQQSGELEEILIFGINSVQEVADIATNVLAAEIAHKEGNLDAAEQLLLDAVVIEDGLSFNEPPDWFFSVRHWLGNLYMSQNEFSKAEEVYRRDLSIFPKNGFALNGLYQSLKAQNKSEEADKYLEMFEDAWKYADSELKYSRIDQAKRQNLAINVKPDSPADLIFLAGNFCGIR
ncbi:MAG: hypothetical protein RIM99_18340 [Cyclobacteriaceae bacterium]